MVKTIVPCKKCDRYPCVCCACGGYMNDWHSHASDCIELNPKYGKDYNKPEKNKNAEIVGDIRDLCEEIKKELNESGVCDYDESQNVLEYVRMIKSMTWYIKE